MLYCVASAWSLVANSGETGMEEVIDVES
jgi:hypothetical protein